MAISFEELEANREALNGLNFQQLKERLDPASLMDGLRWLPDIQLQQSVAKKLIQKTESELVSEEVQDTPSLMYNLRWSHELEAQRDVARAILHKIADTELPEGDSSAKLSIAKIIEMLATKIETDTGVSKVFSDAVLYQKLGTVLMQIGDYSEAIELYKLSQNLLSAGSCDDIEEQAKLEVRIRCQYGIGIALRERDRNKNKEASIKHAEQALEGCETLRTLDGAELTYRRLSAEIERDFGIIYLVAAEYGTAGEHFRKGVEHCEAVNELSVFKIPVENYVALSMLRAADVAKTDTSAAIAYFEKVNVMYLALPNVDQVRDPQYACQDYGSHLFHFGMACVISGNFAQALPLLEEAHEFRKDLTGQQRNRIADLHVWQAKAYEGLKDYAKAIEHVTAAKDIFAGLPNPIEDKVAEHKLKLIELNSLLEASADTEVDSEHSVQTDLFRHHSKGDGDAPQGAPSAGN
jgi:tetratricopeptide (TPR) repeat protein